MTATLHQAAKFFFGGEHLQLVTRPKGKGLLQLWIPYFLKAIFLKEKIPKQQTRECLKTCYRSEELLSSSNR